MIARTVAVAHRDRLVAESIAAALGGFSWIVPIGVATTASDTERLARRADAAALDAAIPGIDAVARGLAPHGVRVVLIDAQPADEDEGVRVAPSDPVSALATALVPEGVRTSGRSPLTAREQQILQLVGKGLTARQVGRQLGIAQKTVENHKTNILAKLRVPNQAAACLALTRSPGGVPRWSPPST